MTYIPDVRNKYENKPYQKEKRLNAYWQKFLNKSDKEFVAGYDHCIEDVVSNLFNNLDVYENELNRAWFADDDDREYDFDYDFINDEKDFDEMTDEELSEIGRFNRVLKVMKKIVLHWTEMERDQLVVSMIDSMDEEEYEAIKKAVYEKEGIKDDESEVS